MSIGIVPISLRHSLFFSSSLLIEGHVTLALNLEGHSWATTWAPHNYWSPKFWEKSGGSWATPWWHNNRQLLIHGCSRTCPPAGKSEATSSTARASSSAGGWLGLGQCVGSIVCGRRWDARWLFPKECVAVASNLNANRRWTSNLISHVKLPTCSWPEAIQSHERKRAWSSAHVNDTQEDHLLSFLQPRTSASSNQKNMGSNSN